MTLHDRTPWRGLLLRTALVAGVVWVVTQAYLGFMVLTGVAPYSTGFYKWVSASQLIAGPIFWFATSAYVLLWFDARTEKSGPHADGR